MVKVKKQGGEKSNSVPGGSETILVAEDDLILRNMVKNLLADLGYQVLDARDGQEALDLFKQKADIVDLLFADIIMPRLTGIELAEQLKAERPDIKLLFTSGYADETMMESDILDIERNFLKKPYELSLLAKKVRHVLDARK